MTRTRKILAAVGVLPGVAMLVWFGVRGGWGTIIAVSFTAIIGLSAFCISYLVENWNKP